QVAVAIHARHGVEYRRIGALQLAAVVERQIVDALGIVQVGVDARIVAIVEEKVPAVSRDEGLHRVPGVAADRHALLATKALVLRCRRGGALWCAAADKDKERERNAAPARHPAGDGGGWFHARMIKRIPATSGQKRNGNAGAR